MQHVSKSDLFKYIGMTLIYIIYEVNHEVNHRVIIYYGGAYKTPAGLDVRVSKHFMCLKTTYDYCY